MPVALLTSELATAMPQNGGYIVWVTHAFGNFAGYMGECDRVCLLL